MTDEMFFSKDMKALRRGKRVARRTGTCRPCLIEVEGSPHFSYHGVVMDISPYGMRIRMMDVLPMNGRVLIQLMRDDDYTIPLAHPVCMEVVRENPLSDGVLDYGLQRIVEPIKPLLKPRNLPAAMTPRKAVKRRRFSAFDDLVRDWENTRRGNR